MYELLHQNWCLSLVHTTVKLMALKCSEIYGAILGLLSGLWSKWNIEGKYYSNKMILTMVIFVIGAIKLLPMNINISLRNQKQLTIEWSNIGLLQICMECMCLKRERIMTICNAKVMHFFTFVYVFFRVDEITFFLCENKAHDQFKYDLAIKIWFVLILESFFIDTLGLIISSLGLC